MSAVSPKVITAQIIEAIQESCGAAIYIPKRAQTHPREFIVSYSGNTFSLWVYVWTLTRGGRASLQDEYRIQMTSVGSPLVKNPKGLTVLMGYYPDLKMFAGFDLIKHQSFTGRSTSVQINISAIHSALQDGLSFFTKDNDEVAIGVRQDNFLTYCINSEDLHLYGAESNITTILTKAITLQETIEGDISSLTTERKNIVRNVTVRARDSRFRKNVLNAYNNRCAVTRFQLGLVDAAHILPVISDDSSDHITNGVALSPTLHRAYDNCLIYLDEDYVMRLNKEKVDDLIKYDLNAGISDFQLFLDRKIHLPGDVNQRPEVKYIVKANKYRRIPGY